MIWFGPEHSRSFSFIWKLSNRRSIILSALVHSRSQSPGVWFRYYFIICSPSSPDLRNVVRRLPIRRHERYTIRVFNSFCLDLTHSFSSTTSRNRMRFVNAVDRVVALPFTMTPLLSCWEARSKHATQRKEIAAQHKETLIAAKLGWDQQSNTRKNHRNSQIELNEIRQVIHSTVKTLHKDMMQVTIADGRRP